MIKIIADKVPANIGDSMLNSTTLVGKRQDIKSVSLLVIY